LLVSKTRIIIKICLSYCGGKQETVLWNVTPCSFVDGTNVTEELAAVLFRVFYVVYNFTFVILLLALICNTIYALNISF